VKRKVGVSQILNSQSKTRTERSFHLGGAGAGYYRGLCRKVLL